MRLLSSHDLKEAELDEICRWLNNDSLMKYSEQRFRIHTRTSQTVFIESFSLPSVYYGIRVNDTLIGTLTVNADRNNRVAELGILIGKKEYQGKGYGLAAWEEAIEATFANGFRKVEAGCMSANDAMMRICEKSGMLIEGCRNRRFVIDDGDSKVFSNSILWGKFK